MNIRIYIDEYIERLKGLNDTFENQWQRPEEPMALEEMTSDEYLEMDWAWNNASKFFERVEKRMRVRRQSIRTYSKLEKKYEKTWDIFYNAAFWARSKFWTMKEIEAILKQDSSEIVRRTVCITQDMFHDSFFICNTSELKDLPSLFDFASILIEEMDEEKLIQAVKQQNRASAYLGRATWEE
jgi:hypothetical protein